MVELNSSYGKAMRAMAPAATAMLMASVLGSRLTWSGSGSDVTKAGRCTETGSTSNTDACTTTLPEDSQELVTSWRPLPVLPGTERSLLLPLAAASGVSDPTLVPSKKKYTVGQV